MISFFSKYFFLLCLAITCLSTATIHATTHTTNNILKNDSNNFVGPVVNGPIEYNNKLYFLAQDGSLYKGNYDLSDHKKIFKTDLASVSIIAQDSSMPNIIYFGEGIHADTSSKLFIFNLSNEKLEASIQINGHIERSLLITETTIFAATGPGGLVAIDKKTKNIIWQKKDISKGKIHVDSSPILVKNDVCFASIYDYKGIVCLDINNGQEVFSIDQKLNPKSDLMLIGNYIVGFSTDAIFAQSKWNIPSTLYIIDYANKKIAKEVDLRGHQFLHPIQTSQDEIFITLSTGDILLIGVPSGTIQFIGETNVPIMSNPFFVNGLYCATAINGKTFCYRRLKDRFELIFDKDLSAFSFGKITSFKDNIYIPTNTGIIKLNAVSDSKIINNDSTEQRKKMQAQQTSLLVSKQVPSYENVATISGTITIKKIDNNKIKNNNVNKNDNNSDIKNATNDRNECGKTVTVWLSQNNAIMYQVEVPISGTFEFKVYPGIYNINATSTDTSKPQCQINETIIVKEKDKKNITLQLLVP